MKKYYRIFQIVNGIPTIVWGLGSNRTNWYTDEADAVWVIQNGYQSETNDYVVLPVWSKDQSNFIG